MNFILLELYKKAHPINFGILFIGLMPTSKINNFRDLLVELHENKLVTRKSKPKRIRF